MPPFHLDFFAADWLGWVQWPAMAATVLAAWLVGSDSPFKRNFGFWLFLASNVLWVVWGLHDNALALIVLQVALAAMNIRGVFKTEKAETATCAPTPSRCSQPAPSSKISSPH